MGQTNAVQCRDCGEHFSMSDGCGFEYEPLRCDSCGQETWIKRSLGGDSWCTCSGDYKERLEAVASSCKCSGRFLVDGPVICPKCYSKNVEIGKLINLYD